MEGDTLTSGDRRISGGVIAGPAVGMSGLQMSYATGRRTRPSLDKAELVGSSTTTTATTTSNLPSTDPATLVVAGGHRVGAPRLAGEAVGGRGSSGEGQLRYEDDEALPPPQPPIVLPSSSAAVRVKEQQLPASGRYTDSASGEYTDGGSGDIDAAADAAVAAEAQQQQQQQGPGLLQKAVDATSSAAQYAAGLASDAYAAVVGGNGGAAAGEEAAGGAASQQQEDQREAVGLQPTGPARPPDAAATIAAAQRTEAAERTAAAAVTTAAVMAPSAAAPSATGQGYIPVVGASVAAAKPAPCVSGLIEGQRVVAERLKGLPEEARQSAAGPSTPASGGRIGHGGGRTGAGGMDEDWVSELVERLWPYIKATVEKMAWEMLPDILEASEPSWIHDLNLKKFVLGNREPDLSNIRVWADENEVMDDCFLEFDFEWHSQTDVELEIQVLPADLDKAWIPNFIEDKLKDLLTFEVGVEDVTLKGRVRLTMRPLLNRVPVIGAVQVSLVEQPEFNFDLTLGNSSNVPLEPALKSWIKQTMQDMVFQTYVSPDHYFLQIDPEAQDVEKPVGVLVVNIVEAKKVPKMDLLSKSSPYVELYVRGSMKRITSTKRPTKRPHWNETFELPVHVAEHQELCMVMYDYDWASANDEIGRAMVYIRDLQPGQMQDLWLDVTSEGEVEMDDKKKDMGKRDRAKIAAAKPLMKQGTKGCQLHVQATYHTFSDAEQKMIAEGQRQGMHKVLDSPQGRQINQHLRNLMLSGTVSVKVTRADDLPVSSLIGRPSVKCVVRAGDQEKEMPAVKASKRGCVQFDQPVELHLGVDVTQNPNTAVTIELKEAGWFSGGSIGRIKVPVQEVIKRRTIKEGYRLEGADSGRLAVEIQWKPYF